MKNILSIITIIGFLISVQATVFAASENDTVKVGTTDAFSGGVAVLPLYIYNSEAISAVEIVLDYDTNLVSIDSFSLVGGRFEYLASGDNFIFNDSSDMIDIFFYDYENCFEIGNGMIGNLFFDVDINTAFEQVVVDSTSWPLNLTRKRTIFSSCSGLYSILPQIVPGVINILEPPDSYDTVWVDNVIGHPDNSVMVNVYGANSQTVDSIDIALEYSSANIQYNSTVFDGTRSQGALRQTVTTNGQQILISVKFPDASPLASGRGELAKLVFDIPDGTPDEIVEIDTTEYLDIWPTIFHHPETGGLTIRPHYIKGSVEIKESTPVNEDVNPLLPKEFALEQNSPNPFNPSTDISFALPRESDVILMVYNLLGEKVRTLVNERLRAGVHHVTFDSRDDNGRQVASGIYFYKIKADDFSRSKKMMLLK
jgi:flagellar hook capping protein FlgD